jgi:hypothetical protein
MSKKESDMTSTSNTVVTVLESLIRRAWMAGSATFNLSDSSLTFEDIKGYANGRGFPVLKNSVGDPIVFRPKNWAKTRPTSL